jgi:hypothetical protein
MHTLPPLPTHLIIPGADQPCLLPSPPPPTQELAQLEYACLAYPPSLQAAAALLLAQMAHRTPTDAAPALASLLQLHPCQLDVCGQALVRLHVAAAAAVGEPSSEPMLAVRTKYESGKMGGVGRVDPAAAYAMPDLPSKE